MPPCLRILPVGLLALAIASVSLRADPGDVENSHDYPGFTRLPGFVISDYDEDNPSEFDFPVARPLPIDADHVEKIKVKGHRYVIRYEAGPSATPPSLIKTQEYYEGLAAAAGFTAEKTGAVGDVSETFRMMKDGRETWVYLYPSITVNTLTIVEGSAVVPPPPPPAPAPVPVVEKTRVAPAPQPAASALAVVAAPKVALPAPSSSDYFYQSLMKNGRVVLPLTFLPGKPDLDADSQPVIDRVAKMMDQHPELLLEVVGHTDSSGEERDNQRLSEQRARTVRAMLLAEHVEKNRLVAVGRGGSQPLVDEKTAEGREKNRRIELVMPTDSTLFHTPAPNGTNYYPAGKKDNGL